MTVYAAFMYAGSFAELLLETEERGLVYFLVFCLNGTDVWNSAGSRRLLSIKLAPDELEHPLLVVGIDSLFEVLQLVPCYFRVLSEVFLVQEEYSEQSHRFAVDGVPIELHEVFEALCDS